MKNSPNRFALLMMRGVCPPGPQEVQENRQIKERRQTKRCGGSNQSAVRRDGTVETGLVQCVRTGPAKVQHRQRVADEKRDEGCVDQAWRQALSAEALAVDVV
ncbi:hypothetical protein [Pseudaminobacter soli (ex Li et al. 2025)]|uniref:hypothetical protein n=1 Tax=Pseudaminobacter soli (ex Li et al. 2025) TaxID=1295366 RepID=UPI003CD01344